MKEFHQLLEKAIERNSVPQLITLCEDAHKEITVEKRGYLDSAMLFDKYYAMDWCLLSIGRLGKFIERGEYVTELERYV